MPTMRTAPLAASAAFGAVWAAWLVKLHQDAVAEALAPGALCGPEGGCHAVLASAWSTVAGVPVSAPAVGLYGAVAVLAALAAAGRLPVEKVAALGVWAGGVGVLFGGFLVAQMVQVGDACTYCLIMDGASVAVLLSAVFAHLEGPIASLRSAFGSVGPLSRWAPAWSVPASAAMAGLLTPIIAPEPVAVSGPVEVVTAPAGASGAPVVTGVAEKTGETRRVVIPAEVVDLPLDASVPTRGRAGAPVTLALFADFQCPFCRNLAGHVEAFAAGRDDVRVAFVHFPMNQACNPLEMKKTLHPDACGAAAAATCAHQQGKFWEMHDVLFNHSAKLDVDSLLAYGDDVGLDAETFRSCLVNPQTKAAIVRQAELGVKAGVTGTPAFFVNGHMFSGGHPPEVLRAIVDAIAQEPTDRVLLDVAVEGEVLGDPPAQAPTEVTLQGPRGPFQIDAFEASVEAGRAVSRPGVAPARGLTWFQAKGACEAAGKRLCAEDEWMIACTGAQQVDQDGNGRLSDDAIEGRPQPYGNYPQPTWCASDRAREDARPLITGQHPRCVTPEGVYDLEGLTKEWIGLSADRAGVKGGSYFSKNSARCGYLLDSIPPDLEDAATGFRCCSGPAPQVVDHHPGGKVGDRFAHFSAKTLTGGEFDTSTLQGKPFVLTFWASWCGPCRQELPALQAMYDKYRDQGFTVVAVNVDEDVSRAKALFAQLKLPFPVPVDDHGHLQAAFDMEELPTAFWVTRSGQIRMRTVGFDEKGASALETHVQALIAAP